MQQLEFVKMNFGPCFQPVRKTCYIVVTVKVLLLTLLVIDVHIVSAL